MRIKKIPMRMCVGCGQHIEKKNLVRVVRSPEGSVSIDAVGRASGRGAYICPNVECLKKAVKARRFENVLGVAIEQSVFETLSQEISNGQ